jgi:hypothetical protein
MSWCLVGSEMCIRDRYVEAFFIEHRIQFCKNNLDYGT